MVGVDRGNPPAKGGTTAVNPPNTVVSQCNKAAAAARKIIGMVRRNFRKLDVEDFLLIYKTYIRPRLEFCIQSWSPYLSKDIETRE